MKPAKTTAVVALLILTAVVVIQNTEAVQTRFLWMSFTLPRALLLLLTFLFGIAAGWLIGARRPKARDKA